MAKYLTLTDRFQFQAVAVVTSGVLVMFIEYVGSKISQKSGDKRETEQLFQRILLAVMVC